MIHGILKDIDFDPESKRLDVYIDFHKGAVFHYESPSKDVKGDFKAYDTQQKEWASSQFL